MRAAGWIALLLAARLDAGSLTRPLEGTVHDDLGAPVTDADVVLQRTAPDHRPEVDRPAALGARSGAGGRFTIVGVPQGEALDWTAWHRDHMIGKGLLGGETQLAIVLDRAQLVSGRVLTAYGEPVREARVYVSYRAEGSLESISEPIVTGVDGRFRFARQRRWSVTLGIGAKGFRTETRTCPALPRSGWPRELAIDDVALARGRTLRGRVVAAGSGEAIAGASVESSWESGPRAYDGQKAESGEDGTFELDALPDRGRLVLLASKDGFAPRTLEPDPQAEEVEIELGRGGRLEGRLCGKRHELEQSELWHGWGPHPASSRRTVDVDPDGRFVLEHAEPVKHTFIRGWILRDPLRPGLKAGATSGEAMATVSVEQGKTATVSLNCHGLPLSGTVTREGRPVARQILRFAHGRGFLEVDALTDDAGRFWARVPKPARYEVWGEALAGD